MNSYVGAFGPGWTCRKASSQTGTCTRSSPLASGSSGALLVVVRITAPTGTILTTTATVAPTDSTPVDNTTTNQVQVTRGPGGSR